MKVREIDIDFTQGKLHWTPDDPEFAQFWNAASTFLPYLEPFLNRTVRAGIDKLPEDSTELREHCRIFIAQEGRHYKNHEKLNAFLRANGYPGLAEREAKMKADYQRFWEKKGHKYCMGYAEGFETLGPIIACFFLEAARELDNTSVDDPTADLWRWHLAEEYEHRHVANYQFHAIYNSYWYRLWGICYSAPHMLGYMISTGWYMVKEDWKSGRIKDPWKSRLRFAGMLARMFAYVVPRTIASLHPKYDPMNLPPPKRAMAVLEQAETRWARKSVTQPQAV
ncbi:MAG: metal-dependent hydrolase [Gammaproteobacteria bacterium]|nr:metal-dependent hydrolase [Gammaproteobacteria bacterium]